MKPFLFLVLIGTSLAPAGLRAQSDLLARWTAFGQRNLFEKMFVHTDKDYYLTGELCWFKCYNVSAATLKQTDLSKVAYVEILDAKNKPVLQAKVALEGGSGKGSFYLPFTLESGAYLLRAYTSLMKNRPAEYFFQKELTIVNIRKGELPEPGGADGSAAGGSTPAGISTAPKPIFHLFPEGGNLVNGLASVLAFQGTDGYGKPLDFTGILLSDRGDTLQHFTSAAMGLGHTTITPSDGRTYQAVVRFADGKTVRENLPPAYADGYVMHLDTGTVSQLMIAISTNKTTDHTLFLLVHSGKSMEMAQAGALENGQVTFKVDKDRLAEGVSHLTVFNEARQPVCERLYFKFPVRSAALSLDAERGGAYTTRQEADLKVTLPQGITHADLSMSVYRLDSLQQYDPTNIATYLWLTSDLGGPVPELGSLLQRPDADAAATVDNLMLTQGWRRFRWEEVLKDSIPTFAYPAEFKGHVILGKIVDTRTGLPVANMQGFLSAPGTRTAFATAFSDSSGRIAFDLTHMYGSSEIVVQTNPSVDSMYRVEINNPFSEVYATRLPRTFALPMHNPRTIVEHSLSMQVQNAYMAMRAQAPYYPDADTAAFYLHPDLTYLLDDYTRFTTMEEVLREYVQLLNVARRGEHFHLWAYDDPEHTPFSDDPLVLVDGVPYFNIDQFMKCDPLTVRRIDVVTRRYFLGGAYFDGILNCVTYKGDLGGLQLDPHATALDYEGLQEKRTFYTPDYSDAAHRASRLPDYRNVLYWNPNVPQSGPVRFSTSDLPGRYMVVVQGISAEGLPLYGKTTIEVKEEEE